MAVSRIYAITHIDDGEIAALVSAPNKAQALSHYARRTLRCEVAIPEQLIEATKGGIEVEKAGEEHGE